MELEHHRSNGECLTQTCRIKYDNNDILDFTARVGETWDNNPLTIDGYSSLIVSWIRYKGKVAKSPGSN
jgi:hypothetical protein